MVVSPCTTFTLPVKVASFFLSRISSEAASIWIGWSRFCEKPCIALGTPVTALCAAATPAQIIASAISTPPPPNAIRHIGVLYGKIFIRSFRTGGLAGGRSRLDGTCGRLGRRRLLGRALGGRRQLVDVHHDVAVKPHHFAAAGNFHSVS